VQIKERGREAGMPSLLIQESLIANVPGGVILSPQGYIDTTNAPIIEKFIEEQIRQKRFKIGVNLAAVDFISSAGWGIFIGEIRSIRSNKGDLVLINMDPDVYDVYELMEFSSIIKSFDTIDETIRYFKTMK
jgi:anti-sigma B factor antagonist